jgi:HlyD family secretion protein
MSVKKQVMDEDEIAIKPDETSEGVSKKVVTQKFRQRSEAAQEIISRQPGFVEKWALVFFLCFLLLLFAGTWFIRYPDIIEATGTLTANNAPKEIIPLTEGRLIRLFVKNGDNIRKGEMIGWIESTANTEEVLDLSKNLDTALALLTGNNERSLSGLFDDPYQNLGELQSAYQTFIAAWQQYGDYRLNGFYSRKKAMLLKDAITLRAMKETLKQQKQLTKQVNDSSATTLKMNKILLDEKVISPEEYRTAINAYLNKKMAIPQFNASILSNENQQREKTKELQQLDHDMQQQKLIFVQALHTLKSNVDDWKHKYILQSPINGTVFFSLPLQQNKFIQQGQLLGYVNPDSSLFYAEIYIPQNNFGKADTGMQVQLRFDAYPYEETGFVKGKLSYISKIAADSGFYAKVRLDNGLITNLKNHIQYKNGLKAEALVITKNMRLLQRIYYSIVKATSIGK